MSVDRLTRVNELMRREIGEALFSLVHENDFDMSAVTVTHVMTSRNLRNARVLISIRDHQDQRNKMMALIKKHRKEIQQRINTNLTLKYTPRLSFELDGSVEQGDHVLNILTEIGTQLHKDEEEPEQSPQGLDSAQLD